MRSPVVERDSVCALPIGGVVAVYDMGTDASGPTGVEHLPGQRPRTAKGRDRMDIVAPSPTSVYRYYDRGGLLLYVGITSRGTSRQREHNSDKDWWQYVDRQTVEHFPTREAALKRERSLIRAFRPPFNKQHNPHHSELRELYMAVAAAGPVKRYPNTALTQLGKIQHRLPLSVVGRSQESVILTSSPEHVDVASALDLGRRRPALMCGTKFGSLIDHTLMGDSLVLTYTLRKDAPHFSGALGHIKATAKPQSLWVNELQIVDPAGSGRVSRRHQIGGAA